MNCPDCEKLLFDYRWRNLDEMAALQVRSHLDSGCEQCNLEFELLDYTVAELAEDIEPILPPSELKDVIFARIGIGNELNASSSQDIVQSENVAIGIHKFESGGSKYRTAGWILQLAGCLFGVWFGYSAYQILTDVDDRSSEVVSEEGTTVDGTNRDIRFVTLQKPGSSQASGTVVFDAIGRQIHVLTNQIAPDQTEASYDVWLTSVDGTNYKLGALTTSESPGVRFNVFDFPEAKMLVSQIAIVKVNGAGASFQSKDIGLVVKLSPPVQLQK